MNSQKADVAFTKEQAADLLRAEFGDHCARSYTMDYYAWPQVFGSTAGPFKGRVAGQAMTSFTIEAWADENYALIFCNGKILKLTCEWEGPGSVRL